MNEEEYKQNFQINPIKGKEGQGDNPYVNGFYFNYTPEFLNVSLTGSYINDRSMSNLQNNIFSSSIKMPVLDSGFSASYGINGYDSRYSSPYFSQSNRGTSPMYGINYSNGGFNAYIQKQKGQSPYFGVNYSKQF